jgi:pyridoxamine 5'-phosphate oxidase
MKLLNALYFLPLWITGRWKALSEETMEANPIRQFEKWFHEAKQSRRYDFPEAMTLSTLDDRGFPATRWVLMKSFDQRGLVFYTNTQNPKGDYLKTNGKVALTFYWDVLYRQVRIQGMAKPVSAEEADAYFRTRQRGSQIGAWASFQSQALESRAVLEQRFKDFEEKFKGRDVPRPAHWTGFRVTPIEFEFWQARPNRLHDRFLYTPKEGHWTIKRLYP